MQAAPYMYDYVNAEVSQHSPSTVHTKNTELQRFFARYLLQKAMSVFKWDLPETWDRDYFLYVLYGIGYIAVINTDRYGVIPQQCGLEGYNIFTSQNARLSQIPCLEVCAGWILARNARLSSCNLIMAASWTWWVFTPT